MMRSLWTASSGMISQQTNVDTIANNLANVNTVGYKKESAEFKTLLYQTIQEKTTDNNGNPKPTSAQVGLGVRNSAISTYYTQGPLQETGNTYDFAIQGSGFFMIQMPDGSVGYTRSGSFNLSMGSEGMVLATSSGNPVLDVNGNKIVFGKEYDPAKLTVDANGNFCYPDEKNNAQPIDITIGVAQFNNPAGLLKSSDSIVKETAASGEAVWGVNALANANVTIKQGYVEGSNVQTADEMVNLIVAQRAYEMNSKIITASDEMLQQANNLR
ncbi:flagellar hook-basal body protein [Anaerosporobacter faecicola]|uniref:flagellar hook-basal body protein n=1 Tax=Anaerosporobacter faecicola TaxID=2718714 RepID=UPI00143CA09B|nr:flagellar hook-basal body protein [Anaerosporobacter faecicola]